MNGYETPELHARLRELGFEIEALGGNCRAFVRPLGDGRRVQVYTEPLWVPEGNDGPIYVGTVAPDDELPPDLQTFGSLREAVEALERSR